MSIENKRRPSTPEEPVSYLSNLKNIDSISNSALEDALNHHTYVKEQEQEKSIKEKEEYKDRIRNFISWGKEFNDAVGIKEYAETIQKAFPEKLTLTEEYHYEAHPEGNQNYPVTASGIMLTSENWGRFNAGTIIFLGLTGNIIRYKSLNVIWMNEPSHGLENKLYLPRSQGQRLWTLEKFNNFVDNYNTEYIDPNPYTIPLPEEQSELLTDEDFISNTKSKYEAMLIDLFHSGQPNFNKRKNGSSYLEGSHTSASIDAPQKGYSINIQVSIGPIDISGWS